MNRPSPCGEVIVKSIPMVADYIVPLVGGLENICSHLSLRFVTGTERSKIEAGAPVIHIRGGAAPTTPGLYVRPLGLLRFGLYGSASYLGDMGIPQDYADLHRYSFIVHDQSRNRAPWEKWLTKLHPQAHIFMHSDCENAHRVATISGHCLGFLPASALLYFPNLIEAVPPHPGWSTQMWMVVDEQSMSYSHIAEIVNNLGDRLSCVWI